MILGVPEVALGILAVIDPWLSALAVLEPSVGTSDGDVHDEVEFLVERCVEAVGIAPWVGNDSAIGVTLGESSALEKWLVEVAIENLKEEGIDIGEDVLLGPLQTEGVLLRGKGSMKSCPLHVGAPPSIVGRVWSPVQCRRHNIVATLCVGVVVASRLDNVNLSGSWPSSIGIVDWQHPDGWP